MVFGDSHVRSLADGIVKMPVSGLTFGFSCTPGAAAGAIRQELQGITLPVTPDLVCILAPSNNLTWSRTIEEAGKDFEALVLSALHRWPRVSDFSIVKT